MTLITFVYRHEENMEVYIVKPDGSGRQNLTNHEVSDSNPRWVASAR